VVADLDTINFRGARTHNGARAFVIHHDTKQLHIGRLRHDRDRRRLGWRWRRWWCWTAGWWEQWALARRRQSIERLRLQRIGQSSSGLSGWLRERARRAADHARHHRNGNDSGAAIDHELPFRQKARTLSVARNSGSSGGRPPAAPAGWIASASTNT